jgi:hypothetical protein
MSEFGAVAGTDRLRRGNAPSMHEGMSVALKKGTEGP